MQNITEFSALVSKIWSEDTSNNKDTWTEDNPARGQCAVTSLLVNDYFDYKIIKQIVTEDGTDVNHYLNLNHNNEEVDLCKSQFSKTCIFWEPIHVNSSTRDYLLSNTDTKARYLKLKERYEYLIGR